MMVLVLTAAPTGLRGDLTKWLLEISPGVYVGTVNKRIREKLWERTVMLCKEGRAILVYPAKNEQRMKFRVHGHSWRPIDLDGLTVMLRPASPESKKSLTAKRLAHRYRSGSNPSWRSKYDEITNDNESTSN